MNFNLDSIKGYLIHFCISALLIASSCAKTDDSGVKGLRLSYGGSRWIADTAYYQKTNVGTNIYATKGSESLEMDLVGFSARTIALDGNNTAYFTSNGKKYQSSKGSVIISRYTDSTSQLTGSFSFTGKSSSNDSTDFTAGYFNYIPIH